VQINRNLLFHRLTAFFVVGFFAIGQSAFAADDEDEHADHDMSGHDMAGHSTERDEEGRRLHDMKHDISPEILAELRETVLGWENITPEEAALSMFQMGPNYEWYISDSDTSSSTGVLILLHGFRDRGTSYSKIAFSLTVRFSRRRCPSE